MATVKRTKNDYIFEHPESRNLYIRLRNSDGRRYVQSLGTTDRREAEIAALPLIAQHKQRLLDARPKVVPTWEREYEPGLHTGLNGERIFATATELHFLGEDGHTIRTEPNGVTVRRLIGGSLSARREFDALDEAHDERPAVPKKSGDDELLETYLKHRSITGYFEREARNVWALYKKLTDSKPLKDADRDDGRLLVKHFIDQGLKSATVKKKVGWLNAAVHLAIEEGKLKFNPFSGVVPDMDDSERRLPLSDADMKAIKLSRDKESKLNFSNLDKADQLLVRLLASTGMRLSEAFEIDGEEKERGVRYVVVGRKTEQSMRRVPLPAAALPFLPKSIKGPLFDRTKHKDPSDAASKRLNKFLDDCGIADPRKVVHSLRHRAQDRLRAAGCPEDVRWAILGHEEETVAAGYGEGFPVPMLRKWIDRIGF
jgi:integrase